MLQRIFLLSQHPRSWQPAFSYRLRLQFQKVFLTKNMNMQLNQQYELLKLIDRRVEIRQLMEYGIWNIGGVGGTSETTVGTVQ